jgi:alginate production protein
LHSIGELGSDFEHWIDAAIVRGNDDGNGIRAYGFEVGITYEPDLALDPLFTLGVALGSGDSNPDDKVDRELRQTGFQESFYHYGEVFAPELSNLWVLTGGGASAYMTEDLSAGLLYRYYRQHRAADALRGAFIFQDPDGEHKELGHALDFVFSYYGAEGLYADLIIGSFFPGDAYLEDSTNAYFGEFIIGYEF